MAGDRDGLEGNSLSDNLLDTVIVRDSLKVGFHYPSSRPELTGVKNAPEFSGRQLGPWTRAVNSGSGNRPLVALW